MTPKSAGAQGRRASVALGLLVASWTSSARASDDATLDLGTSPLALRRIPAGTYTQGSPMTEPGREPDEAPRTVTITRPFWLGKTPVTRGQFSRFVTETRFVTDAEKSQLGGFGWDGKTLAQKKEFTWRSPGFTQKDDDPVVLVSYGDANAFVAWASRKTGKRVRLPTEAEWEYAAKAGTATTWAGATKDDEAFAVGWFRANATGSTHPVGRKRANAFGLFDMAGNVFEWCRDVYTPYAPGDVTDPVIANANQGEPERRVLRGGSWLRDPKRGRSAARHRAAPGARSAESGFRVAMADDAPLAPAPGAVPANDFAPAAPLGMSSATPAASVADVPVPAGSERAPAGAAPARAAEGSGWSLVITPIAAAAFAVAWVLARRRRGEPSPEPLELEPLVRPPLPPPPPPLPPPPPRESVRAVAIAVIADEERPSSPPLSVSAVPTGSPFTSAPSIVASPATHSEALLVQASVVEAELEGAIVDVPLTPVVTGLDDAKPEPSEDAIVDVPLTEAAAPAAKEEEVGPPNDADAASAQPGQQPGKEMAPDAPPNGERSNEGGPKPDA